MWHVLTGGYLYNFLMFLKITDDSKYLASHFFLFKYEKSQVLILILAIILAVWQRTSKWNTLGLFPHLQNELF